MAHEWDRGVLSKSSWHGLEEIGVMADAMAMISRGETSGAWPVNVLELTPGVQYAGGFLSAASGSAVVGEYAAHPARVLGINGDRYRATTPDEWRGIIRAACDAGAQPTGAFSLRGGNKVLATFQVANGSNLRTKLVMVDTFDASAPFMCGFATIDVVCANTLAAAFSASGGQWAKIRHTASAEEKIETLRQSIGQAIASGQSVRDVYANAQATKLHVDDAQAVFDRLFPKAPEDATPVQKTKRDNARAEAANAMAMPINHRGEPGSLATLWNTATWLVDRTAVGTARPCRGGADRLDSLLFGSRGERIAEIQHTIEVVMRDGTVRAATVPEATAMGVDKSQIGSSVLAEMLAELN